MYTMKIIKFEFKSFLKVFIFTKQTYCIKIDRNGVVPVYRIIYYKMGFSDTKKLWNLNLKCLKTFYP